VRAVAVAAAGVALTVAGCDSQSESRTPTGSPERAPAATSDSDPIATLPVTVPVEVSITVPSETFSAPTDNGANPLGGDAPEDKLMPDVVCMNLQEAQDEIQDHGVFLSRSEDASGDDRRQIVDRNWVVVSQFPAAGSPIGERDAILSVLKRSETSDC
jgi:hypothetical protein